MLKVNLLKFSFVPFQKFYDFQFYEFKMGQQIIPPSLFFLLYPGSEIRNGRKSGSGIKIPDPQHWLHCTSFLPSITTVLEIPYLEIVVNNSAATLPPHQVALAATVEDIAVGVLGAGAHLTDGAIHQRFQVHAVQVQVLHPTSRSETKKGYNFNAGQS
jgi:hypothetical protein